MKFIDHVLKLYDSVLQTDFSKFSLDSVSSLHSLASTLFSGFPPDEIFKQYGAEVDIVINNRLGFFKQDIRTFRKIKKVSLYEGTLAANTVYLIFWIIYNDVKLSKARLSDLVEAIYLGSVGFRLFDIHYDDDYVGKESAILGNYMLHLGEQMLIEALEYEHTFQTLNKYLALYTEAEYLEKRNRWKPCPFNWNNPEIISHKAAPIFAVFELIFRLAGLTEKKALNLVSVVKKIATIFQIHDDLKDAKEDLSSGIETLVMSGFYKKFGKTGKISDEMIHNILDENRADLIYNSIQGLFESGREILSNDEDDILSLYLELCNFTVNRSLTL